MEQNIEYKIKQLTGADNHVKSLNDRINQTPTTDVIWSGGRGVSNCYPIDRERIELLKEYGQTYVSYSRSGEVDFTPFEETHVKIADMSSSRAKNFSSANKRVLLTPWAEERNLTSISECEAYFRQNNLTWHECGDGVTMRIVNSDINKKFGHSGGVAEIGEMVNTVQKEDGILRNAGKINAMTKINIAQTSVSVQNVLSEKKSSIQNQEIISAGIDSIKGAEIDIVFVGIQNILCVINEEKEANDAAKDSGKQIAEIATIGIADKVFFDGENIMPQIVSVSYVIKDSLVDYINNKITADEFIINVVKKGVPIFISKNVWEYVKGDICKKIFIQVLTTYVCAAACEEMANIYYSYKSINSMQKEYLSKINKITNQMIEEMNSQREYLKSIFYESKMQWNSSINLGFDMIISGAKNMNMEKISQGIDNVLDYFGGEVEFNCVSDVRDFLNTKDRVFVL